ncbi:tetratricopeptide repeat protein [Flavobacterium zhairuonense]|uniref:tetratricopeptide repeat protein n=1 Tax=Flavobacterium zhairuonense TaxID=2493631 RepID=UPI0010486D5D|nr:tetratricopeptide repeat protein [Flavobacterium zhairuonense]KAF2507805.1 tetratricopeptide repeat protein [Flavobacterium zhairuonense]
MNGETKILKNGAYAYIDYRGLVPHGHNFFTRDYPRIIKELDSAYNKTRDIDYLSDKGYLLIVQKKYVEALNLYLNIEKTNPNRYSTASNLGTLYELMGDNKKAYTWIKKSIEINPKSHNGSEWLHLKILEAKIKNLKDVSGEFLINTSFGNIAVPQTKLSNEEVDKLAKEVYFQVNERMSFIEPKDKIISILLFELGNLVALKGEYKNAVLVFKLARVYGYEDDLLISRMINTAVSDYAYDLQKSRSYNRQIKALRENNKSIDLNYVSQIEISLIIISIIAVILLIVFIVFFRKWKRLKKTTSVS